MEHELSHVTVSEAARRIGVRPRDISDLIYNRVLRDDIMPIITGRRMIPVSYLPQIVAALERAGRKVRGLVEPPAECASAE